MPAFEAAVALGYRYVETDVHVTVDGVLVAFHDPELDRVSDRTGAIDELLWKEVAAARIGGTASVPRLEDLLAAFPDVRINVDPKSDRAVEPLADVIQRMGALERVCVGSFSDERIERLRHRLGPGLCTSLGPRATARLRAASFGLPVGAIVGSCVQVPTRARGRTLVDERFLDAAHGRGLPVHVWTIDEADEMHRLLDLGVDGIMTDRPARLKAVLEARGQWG